MLTEYLTQRVQGLRDAALGQERCPSARQQDGRKRGQAAQVVRQDQLGIVKEYRAAGEYLHLHVHLFAFCSHRLLDMWASVRLV